MFIYLFIIIIMILRIPWLKYINRLLAPHVEVGLDEVTIVSVPKYITDLEVSVKYHYILCTIVCKSGDPPTSF